MSGHSPNTWRTSKVSEQFKGALRLCNNRAKDELSKKYKAAISIWMDQLIALTYDIPDYKGGVTGNLINGWFIALFYNGKHVYHDLSAWHLAAPTRRTLKYKEYYDLPTYYSGALVFGKPYRGKTGDSNYDAAARSERIIKQAPRHIKVKKGLTVIVGNSVKYLSFIEKARGVDLHTEFAAYARSLGMEIQFLNAPST